MVVSHQPTDVDTIWQAAIRRYKETTKVDLGSLTVAKSVDDILLEINDRDEGFKRKRHDKTKLDKFRTLVSKSLQPIQTITEVVSQALSETFPPSAAIFTAVRYMITTANCVSADYDKLTEFFNDLMFYLNDFKIIEGKPAPGLGLEAALTEVLTSVLELCGICAKYTKSSRLSKAWRSLAGEDKDLTQAYDHFHKMVDRARCRVEFFCGAGVRDLCETMRENECKDMLDGISTQDFLSTQKEKISRHQSGTCQWVLRHEAFQQWYSAKRPSTLWCYGDHGCGKTILASFLIDFLHETTERSDTAIAYIYCNYKDRSTHSTYQLLSSIARQIMEQVGQLPPVVKQFRDQNATKKRNPTGEEWIALIQSLSGLFSRTIIVVDALDECPDTTRDEFLRFMNLLDGKAQFIFTSRPHIELPVAFTGVRRMRVSAHSSDLRLFLESEISRTRWFHQNVVGNDHALREQIIQDIVAESKGMFLLARLHIGKVCSQPNKPAVKKTLGTLPGGIFQYYDEAVQRIEAQEESLCNLAKQAILFISHAKRPLRVKEIHQALGVWPGDTGLVEGQCVADTLLINMCAGLVRTALDFAVSAGHERIVEDLLLRAAKVNSIDSGGNTALHWAVPREQITKLLLHHGASVYHQNDAGQTALHWAARDGSTAVAKLLLTRHADVRTRDENGATPLHSAALQGHEQIINLLLASGADRNVQDIDGWTPLYSAAVQEHEKIVSLLLDRSRECRRVMEIVTEKMEDPDKRTRVKILAKQKSQGSTVLTGLRVAAQEGHSGRLQTMLDRGADVNAKDPAGYTALEIAAFQDFAQIVQILLEAGADANLRGSLDYPPLHYAVEQGNIASSRLLVKYGADVNADTYGTTPLMLAAKLGKQRIYRILLEANANTNARDCTGKTTAELSGKMDASKFWTGDLVM